MGNRLAHVPVFLRRSGRVELLELETAVDDRLEQVQRSDRVRHHCFVRSVPRLADVCLRAEMEDVWAIACLAQVLHQVVDRRLIGEIGEVNVELSAEMPDVVQRAARRRSDERVHRCVERHEGFGQVRAHEAVSARDQACSLAEVVAVLRTKRGQRFVRPGRV